jgi:O-antigen ligase
MSAFGATAGPVGFAPPRQISAGVRRLVLAYVWITVATSAVVFSEPALYDVMILGAALLLPVAGLVAYSRGLAVYLMLWAAILAGSFIATTQAGVLGVPLTHSVVTLYLAATSVVIAAFVAQQPEKHAGLIMSAYMVAALVAACAALIGYFNLMPGAYELFTEYGRARGTFKDPNVFGAFLAPALLYAFNQVMNGRAARAGLWLVIAPVILVASMLSFSRGAWINLAVSLFIYACFTFVTVSAHRQRLKLIVYVALAGLCAVIVLAAAQSIPAVAELMGERASFEQSYDVGPEGRFGGQAKAVELIAAHPLGIGALEFSRNFHPEDVHEVYLSMFLNSGWIGGTLYLALVLLTIGLGLRQVLRDRGGDGLSAVLVAAFIGMALEGLVIDTDHWRHFFLFMAMIWGMALAAPSVVGRSGESRASE